MFALRKIHGDNTETNIWLGECYSLTHSEISPADFEAARDRFGFDKDETYAIIAVSDGKNIIPLFKKQKNYIMTENGATFANVSLRS